MDRRLVIATVFLVLAIIALALMGMSSAPQAGGDPQLRPLLPWMMSGDFAPTQMAATSPEAASPSVRDAAPSGAAPRPS
jgi:uncharacterized RDD family membrane protein YckC